MRLPLLPASLLALILPTVFADVEFTSPGPGDKVPVGTIEVEWRDSGNGTSLLDLTQYTLLLMTGGNTQDDMRTIGTFVSGGTMSAGHNASGTLSPGVAGELKNGFFFKMEAASRLGGQVVNYSPRFSIVGLTGYTPPEYRDAAAALDGSTDAPDEAGQRTQSEPLASTTRSVPTETAAPTRSHGSAGPTSPSEDSQDDASSGLSVGIQAGIGVAGAVVGGCVVGLITWMVLRRKWQVKEIETKRKSGPYLGGKVELSGETFRKHPSTSTTSTFGELSPESETFEMGSQVHLVREMEGGHSVYETEGTTPASETEGSATASEMQGSQTVYELPAQRFSNHGG